MFSSRKSISIMSDEMPNEALSKERELAFKVLNKIGQNSNNLIAFQVNCLVFFC